MHTVTSFSSQNHLVRSECFLCHHTLLHSSGKESACNAGTAGDTGLSRGSGRSPGGGQGNPLQYSCWENPIDRRAWRATVHRFAKSQTRLSDQPKHLASKLHTAKHLGPGRRGSSLGVRQGEPPTASLQHFEVSAICILPRPISCNH